ncbi:hypothetical protein OSB04_020722 [Centaurea solstitialis]|uniref:GST N-terminal domain-containing protein n=1 Tax=Centaurea solstitialis TaxID=347529 RepID=A0AA38WFJ1_9ASTR|nr:hypothetical protein OSB04_020722 [Centaurea solstitialis]
MADEVKLYAVAEGSFVFRAKIALNIKGIEYENIEEDLSNKSADVLKYNHVHKKLPILLHNGKPISESLVIVEYITIFCPMLSHLVQFLSLSHVAPNVGQGISVLSHAAPNMGQELLSRPVLCCTTVKIALNLKGIKYENFEEDLDNKSADLLKYNPVHKKVPVLVHNGKSISESLVIVEYIDDVWKGVSILSHDPYERAVARFWAKFIDDKFIPAIFKVFTSNGDEQAITEAYEQLQILEMNSPAKVASSSEVTTLTL